MSQCLYCYKSLKDGIDFHTECSKAFFGSTTPPVLPYSIDEMAALAKDVVERSITVPGVQAKLSLSLINEVGQKTDRRLTVVGALGGNYIFKPPSSDFKEMPQNEHLTMRLAELFKIQVAPSSLIRMESGELSYITKRMDRTTQGKKIHILDMFQITEAFDKYKSSMEKVGKALGDYSANPLLDKLYLFEITLFSFLTGNNDMHLKNFSMIFSMGNWQLAPCYDLLNVALLIPYDKEELALTLNGKKNNFKKNDFDLFGKKLGLSSKQIEGVYKRFKQQQSNAMDLIQQSFLNVSMKRAYAALFTDRLSKF